MKITIIGAGSWGTALAMVLSGNGHKVTCWTIEQDVIDDVKSNGQNSKYLRDILVPNTIDFTMDLEKALKNTELIVNALPSQVSRKVIPDIVEYLKDNQPVWVTVSKGIENNTFLRISEVISQVGNIPKNNIAALSGPSHAEEVSRRIPTAIVAASTDIETAHLVQNVFKADFFRVYSTDDIIGVELGGALKNIIALAAGICDGAGFGDNTKAALMTRGLVEINRLGVKMGALSKTFAGLSGMGDLIVTCMSRHSRNRYVGEQIGKGRPLQNVLDEMVMVAEGVKTTLSAYELSRKENIEMPITEQIYLTLFENKAPEKAMYDLMTRASKIEDWG